MHNIIRQSSILATLLLVCMTMQAQEKEYMYEIGGGAGMSWGYGDASQGSAMYSPTASFGLLWKYNLNLRWTLAVDLASDGIQGDISDLDYKIAPSLSSPGATLNYDRRLWQLDCRPEFTFWNYGWGSDFREKKRLAPFLTMGLGLGLASGDVTSSDSSLAHTKSSLCLTMPMGLGIKWKIAPRWNIQLTCLWTKCWGDEVDGLQDLTGIKTSGIVKNDWVGSARFSVTFDIKERCEECHRN